MVYFGLSPDAFLAYTPLEYDRLLTVKAHSLRERHIAQLEAIRMQTTILLQPHVKKGSNLKPSSLWPFPWDKEKHKNDTNGREMTEADWELLDQKFKT